jgi:hypothetical protein
MEKLLLVAGVRPAAASFAVHAIRRSSSAVGSKPVMNKIHSQLVDINTKKLPFH